MTRKDTKVDRLEAVVSNDGLIEVRYHDGSDFTFNLVLADKTVPFVDGVAHVDAETATLLRDGGHVA